MAKHFVSYRLRKSKNDTTGLQAPDSAIREHPLFSGKTTVGMITGANPLYPAASQGGHEALGQELKRLGLHIEPTDGRYGVEEPSYIVYGPTREQMFDLGKRYGQEAVVYSEGGKHEMLYTNGPDAGMAHPSLPTYDYFADDPPEDYYTRLPSTGGYLRLHFADHKVETPLRRWAQSGATPQVAIAKKEYSAGDVGARILSLLKSLEPGPRPAGREHPHAYHWHDPHTDHHFKVVGPGGVIVVQALAKADGASNPHPHMDGPPVAPGAQQHQNDQAAGVGVPTYAKYAAPFGDIRHGQQSDLFHYDYHGKLPEVERLVKEHGYQTYYAGGKYGRPDLANRNYNTGHLMVYDPTPKSGGDFGQEDYTKAWRQIHELSHALVYPELNKIYGEGRRIGKLGYHRTLNEALRAVHWEWLAAHKQRDLSAQIGVHIPDDVFHQELNTVMHDAVHRAVTGKFTEPSAEGFHPHRHKVPLEVALGMVKDAAHNLGLVGMHDTLRKSEGSTEVSKTYTVTDLGDGVKSLLKARVDEYAGELRALRQRELKKAEPCDTCGEKTCKCEGVLPGDKPSKDVTPKESGHGGEPKKGKQLDKDEMEVAKADVPMAPAPTKPGNAAPPKAKAGSPKPTAAPAPTSMGKSQSPILAKRLAKAGPRLGGKDPLSQQMTQDAFAAAPTGAAPAAASAGPKLSPEEQARRAAEYASFTPAGAFTPAGHGTAAAGALKPGPAQPPPGTSGLTPPPASMKPQGTSAAPPGGRLARFTAALRGQKNQKEQSAMKSEGEENSLRKSLGNCALCGKPEHSGTCQ